VPIFTGFGPDAVGFRVQHSGARLLCTHADVRDRVPPLPGIRILTIGEPRADDVPFADAIAGARDDTVPVPCRRDDPAVLLYTSGSTGPPRASRSPRTSCSPSIRGSRSAWTCARTTCSGRRVIRAGATGG
jgi:acetyl-CoA synthetase